MNAFFVEGQLSYSLSVNSFTALSFEEFAQRQSGMGVFANNFTGRPEFDNRGVLRFIRNNFMFNPTYSFTQGRL